MSLTNLLLAQTESATTPANDATSAPKEIPTDLGEVSDSIMQTLGGVWSDFVSHLPLLAAGLLVVLATWIVAKIAERVVGKMLKRRKSLRESIRALFVRFTTIGVWVAGLLLAAMVVFPGLTPSSALGALGLVSVAVGLAFKDIFENFFAGILLLWRFPFEKGDFIECEGLVGRVEDVQIRMSQIRKTTGELVVVPNAFLFKNAVQVLTASPKRRVHLLTGVAYGENVPEAVEIIQNAVESCETVDADHPVQVFSKAFGASSIDIDVAWWTGSRPLDFRESVAEVLPAIKGALDEAGIEIPFPYRTLTFNEPLPVRQIGDDGKSSHEPTAEPAEMRR